MSISSVLWSISLYLPTEVSSLLIGSQKCNGDTANYLHDELSSSSVAERHSSAGGRLERSHATKSRSAGPICCNGWSAMLFLWNRIPTPLFSFDFLLA
jgi:hypothetical protein